MKIAVDEKTNAISKEDVEPIQITSGRVLSPWHEISFYGSEQRLAEGIASYDKSCTAKGIKDYVMITMKAPDGFHEASVLSTSRSIIGIGGEAREPTEEELKATASRMKKLDHMIYFVPQLQSAPEYLEMIRASGSDSYEEAKEFEDVMEGDELLNSLQSYALDAPPKVDRDYFEIGYPAKFRNKLIEQEGWSIEAIHRRGAFARNTVLSDETILGEIGGESGTSGQRLKRTILLSDAGEFAQALRDVPESLPNNPVWVGMIRNQLEEARKDFPNGDVAISIFSPSTGLLTIFFAITRDFGYVPCYSLAVNDGGELRRIYFGELSASNDQAVGPQAFRKILDKYYDGSVGNLVMSMTWGGYETRDLDIMEDVNLLYGSFRTDVQGDERKFYRMQNGKWRAVAPIIPFNALKTYFDNNQRLLTIIYHKFSPRIGGVITDGSSADRQLEDFVDPETEKRAVYYDDAPDQCDVCNIPLLSETYVVDGKLADSPAWANMCADCAVYYGAGIGWGIGQLYRKQSDGRLLLVSGGGPPDDEDE